MGIDCNYFIFGEMQSNRKRGSIPNIKEDFALQLVVEQLNNLNSAFDVINDFVVAFEYLGLTANLETTRFKTIPFKLKSPCTVIDQVFTIPKLVLGTTKNQRTLRVSFVQTTKIGLSTEQAWSRDVDLGKCYQSGKTNETTHEIRMKGWSGRHPDAKLKITIRTAPKYVKLLHPLLTQNSQNALQRKQKAKSTTVSTPRKSIETPRTIETSPPESIISSLTSTPSFADDDDSIFVKNMSCDQKSNLINNKYEIIKTIGRGAFGTVYLVRDSNTSLTFALKEIHCQSETEINNAMREGFNASTLKHEHLVEIKSIFVRNYQNELTKQNELFVCILMPLYEHGDLANHLKLRFQSQQYFSELEILEWMIQITKGVHYLHAQDFLHRDLKPGNIFLSNDQQSLAIGDFGLVREMENTFASTVAGTLKYMAPEVLSVKQYNYGADMWSLGCIFLEMILLHMERNLYMEVFLKPSFYKDIQSEVAKRGYSNELGKILCDMLAREPPRTSALDLLVSLTGLKERIERGDQGNVTESSKLCEGECGNIATVECHSCKAYMCEECFTSSHRFGVLKQHIKVDINPSK
jgi:hypothetical protein